MVKSASPDSHPENQPTTATLASSPPDAPPYVYKPPEQSCVPDGSSAAPQHPSDLPPELDTTFS